MPREADVAPDALRFLGRAGLLPDASPGADATPEYRERLRFVRHARGLGCELHEIRALLSINDGVSQEMTPLSASIDRQIENVEQRIIALMRVRQALLQTQDRLDHGCPHSHGPILAALEDDRGD